MSLSISGIHNRAAPLNEDTTTPTPPTLADPVLKTIEWMPLTGTGFVRFHLGWENPSPTDPTSPISGVIRSQAFGLFLPDFGPIGEFDVPAIEPDGSFDVSFDVPLSMLPANPRTSREPSPEEGQWFGNVKIRWTGLSGERPLEKHIGELLVCPGDEPSWIALDTLGAAEMPWSISGVRPGYTATLLNGDMTPAPNPAPAGWWGYISVSAAPGTPVPDSCCIQVTMVCQDVPGVIDMRVSTRAHKPADAHLFLTPVPAKAEPGARAPELAKAATEAEADPWVAAETWSGFGIRKVMPNPSARAATIEFSLPEAQRARLEIFDGAEKPVRVLVDQEYEAGDHRVVWNGRDAAGIPAWPGVYSVRLSGGTGRVSTKMVLRL